MSTRCIVRIKENNKQTDIYHHHDGYPEGVGVDLYMALTPLFDKAKKQIKDDNKMTMLDFNRIITTILAINGEYEITECTHNDIEYMYIVDLNKAKIDCLEGRYNNKSKFVTQQKHELAIIADTATKSKEP